MTNTRPSSSASESQVIASCVMGKPAEISSSRSLTKRGSVKPTFFQQRAFVEDFLWRAFHDEAPFGEYEDAIRAQRLLHKLCDHHDTHAGARG